MAVCDTFVLETEWERAAPCVEKLLEKYKLIVVRAKALFPSIYSLTNILCTHCMPTISVFIQPLQLFARLTCLCYYLLFLLFPCDLNSRFWQYTAAQILF